MRIVAVPLIVACFLLDFPAANWVCWCIFTLAGVTDFFDGYLARKYQLESKLGAFLDPVADKMIVVLSLILLVNSQAHTGAMLSSTLFVIAVIIIVGREVFVSALREWMAEQGKRDNVSVSSIGKFKTRATFLCGSSVDNMVNGNLFTSSLVRFSGLETMLLIQFW